MPAENEDNLPNELTAPTKRALVGAGYTSLEQLQGAREADILALHGMGPKVVTHLREMMAERGIYFAS